MISADTERDNFMSAEEAKEYGLIDEVISTVTKTVMSEYEVRVEYGRKTMMIRCRCSFCNKTQAQVRKLIAGPERRIYL